MANNIDEVLYRLREDSVSGIPTGEINVITGCSGCGMSVEELRRVHRQPKSTSLSSRLLHRLLTDLAKNYVVMAPRAMGKTTGYTVNDLLKGRDLRDHKGKRVEVINIKREQSWVVEKGKRIPKLVEMVYYKKEGSTGIAKLEYYTFLRNFG